MQRGGLRTRFCCQQFPFMVNAEMNGLTDGLLPAPDGKLHSLAVATRKVLHCAALAPAATENSQSFCQNSRGQEWLVDYRCCS